MPKINGLGMGIVVSPFLTKVFHLQVRGHIRIYQREWMPNQHV